MEAAAHYYGVGLTQKPLMLMAEEQEGSSCYYFLGEPQEQELSSFEPYWVACELVGHPWGGHKGKSSHLSICLQNFAPWEFLGVVAAEILESLSQELHMEMLEMNLRFLVAKDL